MRESSCYRAAVLRVLVDTSTWLDLARLRDGQTWIVALCQLMQQGELELLVPEVLIHEFLRNRGRVEAAMSSGVSERFRNLRRDIVNYGGEDRDEALNWIDALAHHVPLIGAMTTRNFDDILDLLGGGRRIEPDDAMHGAVVRRGLEKLAPLHRNKNSVADALLIELYASVVAGRQHEDAFAFVTSNSSDFSASGKDPHEPHPDFAVLFASDHSTYVLGVDGLISLIGEQKFFEFEELVEEAEAFREEPRRLDEILRAEQEFFDRVWHERHLMFRMRYEAGDPGRATVEIYRQALAAAEQIEGRWPDVRPVESDFEWGMWNGKLSALRWVLGSEWDFLDT